MKVTLNRVELKRACDLSVKFIKSKNTLHILDNFMMEFKEGSLTITASDSENTIKVKTSCEATENYSVCVNAKKLNEALSLITDSSVTLDFSGNIVKIVHSGKNKLKMPYSSSDEYPTVNNDFDKSIVVPTDMIASVISSHESYIIDDILRPQMSGILFEFENGYANFVATDSSRLIRTTCELPNAKERIEFIGMVRPLQSLKYIKGIEELTIHVSDKNTMFDLGNIQIYSRVIEGKYPNYRAVIQTNNAIKCIVDKKSLEEAAKRVNWGANESSQLLKFTIVGGELNISSQDVDLSYSAEETIPCRCNGDIIIGLKSSMFIEMLSNVCTNNVVIELSEPSRPIIVLDEGSDKVIQLLMPMML